MSYRSFVCMFSCLGTGNMQLPYNSLGGYLVHILFSSFVFFLINGPGQTSGKSRYDYELLDMNIVMNQHYILWKILCEKYISKPET